MIEYVRGNLLDAKETFICHQTNCVSKGSSGLAATIFAKWPGANVYRQRKEPSEPGTNDIRKATNQSYVVNMMAQFLPGPPSFQLSGDCSISRAYFFLRCLMDLLEHHTEGDSYAFPYMIGCGLAEGTWSVYQAMLENFEITLKKKDHRAVVKIYRLE